MAKLSLTELRNELARRLKQLIQSTDTATLDSAIQRAIRAIDGLASYTFLQKHHKATLFVGTDNIDAPSNLNYNKDIKLYLEKYPPLKFVPYTELEKYDTFLNSIPEAFAYYYDAAGAKFYFSNSAPSNLTCQIYYSENMVYPTATDYAQIPEHWYDIIIDVAEAQQKSIYSVIGDEIAIRYVEERLKLFLKEYGVGDINVNINDILNKSQ